MQFPLEMINPQPQQLIADKVSNAVGQILSNPCCRANIIESNNEDLIGKF